MCFEMTIYRFEKKVLIEYIYKNMLFLGISLVKIFIFFIVCYFLEIFV